MKPFAILFAVLLASSAICQIPETHILNKRTAFPCSGFKVTTASFYDFNAMASPIKFNVPTIKSKDGQEYWIGEAVVFPCTLTVSDKIVKEDCGEDYAVGKSVGYYKLRKNVEGSIYTCYAIADTDDRTNWSLDFDPDVDDKGAWVATGKSTLSEESIAYNSSFVLSCGNSSIPQDVTSTVNHDTRTLVFKLSSKEVCPYTSGTMVSYLSGHRAVPFFLLGLAIFITFFGYYFIKTVLFIMGFLIGIFLALFGLAISTLIKINDPNLFTTNQIILSVFIVIMVGCLLGYIFAKVTKFYFMFAGGFMGYMISFKSFELLVMATSKSNDVAQIVVVVVCVILGVVAGYYLHDHVMILSTAFGGAFLITLCVGTILKNYPDIDNLPNYSKLDPEFKKMFIITFASYTLAWLVIAVLGSFCQYNMKNKQKPQDDNTVDPQDGYLSYDADPTADRNYY